MVIWVISQSTASIDFHKPHQQGKPIKEIELKKIYTKLIAGHFIEVEFPKKQEEK